MQLFDSIVGNNEEGSIEVALHLIQSVTSEVEQGRLTFSDAVDIMKLEGDSVSDYLWFIQCINNSTDKALSSGRIFNYLILGTTKIKSPHDYTDGALFKTFVEQECNV